MALASAADLASCIVFSDAALAAGKSNLPIKFSLNNLSGKVSFAKPMVSFVQVFADGDIPAGGSVTATDSGGNPVAVQMDQIATWPSGCVRKAELTFVCAETWGASASKNYSINSSASAPDNSPNSVTWGGTTAAAWVAALAAASNFKVVFTGFDAGSATYDMQVNRIIRTYNNVTSGWGTSYPRGGWEVVKQGPACLEFRFWEYIENVSSSKTHGYVRVDMTIKCAAPAGPYDIDCWVSMPNIWNTVPLSSAAEQFGNKAGRFAAIAEIYNGATRVEAGGGANDPRAVTISNANFNTATNRIRAALNSFFPQCGVAFSSSGTLPSGNMSASDVYYPVYPYSGANPWLIRERSSALAIDNNAYHNWAANQAVGVGDLYFNATSNIFYICRQAGTTSSSGTGPSGTGAGINDGTATWDCISVVFTSQGTGTITAYPVYAAFPSCGYAIVDQKGNPLHVGTGSFPEIFPGHDFPYLTTASKFTPPYNLVATVEPTVITLATNYNPHQNIGGLPSFAIDSTGDGVGDQRVGYLSEWAVGSLFQPAEPRFVYSVIQQSISWLNYPWSFMFDESGGHPLVANNGTNNSGAAYTHLPNPIPGWNEFNIAGHASPGIAARGNTWSAWSLTARDWNGFNGQYYFDDTHYPCTWQVPYLKTARYIFLCQAIAHTASNCAMTYNATKTVGGATYRCIIGAETNSDQLRGWGWGTRTLVQCMYLMPDRHPMQNYIRDLYNDTGKYHAVRLASLPANQQVLGFFPNAVEQGVRGGVGGWAPWMGFITMVPFNMEQWRGGLTSQEASKGYWGQAADFFAKQWQIWDPAIDPKAPNSMTAYRLTYGPTPGNWSTSYTTAADVANHSYSTNNIEIAPYPTYPYDHDNDATHMIAPGNINAWNYYGNMGRMALKIRTLGKPSDTLAANVLAQFTANIIRITGRSTEGGFRWGYLDHGGSGVNPLAFCCF